MKKLIAAAALLAALTGNAWSADMAVKARPMAVVAPAFTWTGCFVGINGGYVWGQKNWRVEDPANTPLNFGSEISHDPKGGMVGGQIGCDGQYQNWVFGFQIDGDWVDAKASGDYFTTGLIAQSRIKALGSATGRVGYAFDKLLLYVRGGFAWERDEYQLTTGPVVTSLPIGTLVSTATQNRVGWTVGAGGEYVWWTAGSNQLSLFVEYDHYDFGRGDPLSFIDVSLRAGSSDGVMSIRETKDIVKGGINFRFATGAPAAAAVVAKY